MTTQTTDEMIITERPGNVITSELSAEAAAEEARKNSKRAEAREMMRQALSVWITK